MEQKLYITLPIEQLEKLKDFDNWKEFKNNPNYFNNTEVEIHKKIIIKKNIEVDPWDNYSGTHF